MNAFQQRRVTPGRKRRNARLPFYGLLFLLVAFLSYMAFEKFDDFVRKNPDGGYELREKRKDKLNDRVIRLRTEAEQYVLRAVRNGYYQCLHCPNGVFYLYANEVWKFGTTIRGESGRYKPQYLSRMGLRYDVEYRGTIQKAMEMETIRIGQYPLLPENISRPDKPKGEFIRYKLARPPGQATDS